MNRALFLDRDGVINVEKNYVYRIDDFEFIEGIYDLVRFYFQKDYLIIVITNQAGIGRGYYTEQDFHLLTRWMCEQFKSQFIEITRVYFCPHHPDYGVGDYKQDCDCRKPKPGMILEAAKDFNIDLQNSILIGDKLSDIEAGIRAGIGKKILISSDKKKKEIVPDLVVASIKELNQYLL